MSYIPEDEAQKHIGTIINLFKQSKYDEVISIIKQNNIDPQHSENIISDYAALWLEEPHLIPFLKKIKEIGGDPLGHHTITANVSRLGKNETLKYLIEEGALTALAVRDELVYILNGVISDGSVDTLKLLANHLDITQYKLLNLNESNPSIVNRALSSNNEQIIDYLFEKNIIQPYLFSNEAISSVENLSDTSTKNFIINKILDNFGIDKKKYELPTDKYEPGDVSAIFKMIHVDILDKELKINTISAKPRKI